MIIIQQLRNITVNDACVWCVAYKVHNSFNNSTGASESSGNLDINVDPVDPLSQLFNIPFPSRLAMVGKGSRSF